MLRSPSDWLKRATEQISIDWNHQRRVGKGASSRRAHGAAAEVARFALPTLRRFHITGIHSRFCLGRGIWFNQRDRNKSSFYSKLFISLFNIVAVGTPGLRVLVGDSRHLWLDGNNAVVPALR